MSDNWEELANFALAQGESLLAKAKTAVAEANNMAEAARQVNARLAVVTAERDAAIAERDGLRKPLALAIMRLSVLQAERERSQMDGASANMLDPKYTVESSSTTDEQAVMWAKRPSPPEVGYPNPWLLMSHYKQMLEQSRAWARAWKATAKKQRREAREVDAGEKLERIRTEGTSSEYGTPERFDRETVTSLDIDDDDDIEEWQLDLARLEAVTAMFHAEQPDPCAAVRAELNAERNNMAEVLRQVNARLAQMTDELVFLGSIAHFMPEPGLSLLRPTATPAALKLQAHKGQE